MDMNTPVGRILQGSVQMQPQKDMETGQPLLNPDGTPQLGVFLALGFPKVLPNGQPNSEFDAFFSQLKQVAAAAWPTLFPQGPNGPCANPRFSWKYQDGDGVDHNGKSVADKPGFKGHHVVKFYTAYPVRCYHDGKFGAHEEIQNPQEVIKRGYWVFLNIEAKGNNATGNQVPGISLYPRLLSFVERGEEITSGPDAQAALGGTSRPGWRPAPSASPIPTGGSAVPTVSVPVVAPPQVNVPTVVIPPQVIAPQYAAQGVTWDMLTAQGWTEVTARAQGYIV